MSVFIISSIANIIQISLPIQKFIMEKVHTKFTYIIVFKASV